MADLDPVRQAAERLLRARYYSLRQHVPGWTHTQCSEYICEAEDDLWEALSGHRDVIDAARAVGLRMAPEDGGPPLRGSAQSSKLKRRKRSRLEDSPQGGFFD